jgi:GDPmannose 4,6-dehydratase
LTLKHKKKIALITGITGQDGSYLADFLIKKKYIVHGIKRRTSLINTKRIDHLYEERQKKNANLILHYGDLTDSLSLSNLIYKIKPDEIYNLAAQSHVSVSFEIPEYTSNVVALGALRILECIRQLGLTKKTKFYQAGSSEMFGGINKIQNEKTKFNPKSPYAVAKTYAHWITINYREAYNIFACNGILFNHESPLRGETFVTKKIINGLCKIKKHKSKKLYLGNIYSKRDWGHAKDYVEAMWLILQQKRPDDFIISNNKAILVKEFINIVSKKLNIKIFWKGKGVDEKGYDKDGNIIIEIDKRYLRPQEVNYLRGSFAKAKKIFGWEPKTDIHSLVDEMIKYEFNEL